MNWRPHTEPPSDDAPVFTALIAVRDSDADPGEEFYLLEGMYMWKERQFTCESTGLTITQGRAFWWIPESEVLEGLKGETHDSNSQKTGTTGRDGG